MLACKLPGNHSAGHWAKKLTYIISFHYQNISIKGVLLLFPGYKWGIWGRKQLRTLSRTIWYHLKNLTWVTWLFFCFLSSPPKSQCGKVAMAKPLFNNNLFPRLFICMRSLWRKGQWDLQEAISLLLEKRRARGGQKVNPKTRSMKP